MQARVRFLWRMRNPARRSRSCRVREMHARVRLDPKHIYKIFALQETLINLHPNQPNGK